MRTYKYKCAKCGTVSRREWRGKSYRSLCDKHEMMVTMRLVPGQPEPVVRYAFTFVDPIDGEIIESMMHDTRADAEWDRSKTDGRHSRVQRIVLDPPPRRGK